MERNHQAYLSPTIQEIMVTLSYGSKGDMWLIVDLRDYTHAKLC